MNIYHLVLLDNEDVLDKLREMGWKQVETEKVEVSF